MEAAATGGYKPAMTRTKPTAHATQTTSPSAPGEQDELARGLCRLLADTYALYLKTQNYHWNVTGPEFFQLHVAFEAQYRELAEAVDEIAERIRALGYRAPGSFAEFVALSSLADQDDLPSASAMAERLAADHTAVAATARSVLRAAQDADDEPTGDLMVQRQQEHEKRAWMLRSCG